MPSPASNLDRTIAAIVARHQLRTQTWTQLASLGAATTIYLLDDVYVLRVPHPQPAAIAGVCTDPIVIPVARAAGVHTPALIAFDTCCDLLPVPYGVYERVPGEPLDRLLLARDATPDLWHALGRDIALLHSGVTSDGPAGQIAANTAVADPFPWLHEISANSLIGPDTRAWFTDWLQRLAPYAYLPITPRFCHGDVNGGNIMVDPATQRYRALIDWGGVFWGDASWDFAPVSLRAVPAMLQGYRTLARLDHDATAEARILWHHIVFTIYGIWKHQQRGAAWAQERVAHLRENLMWFISTPAVQWIAHLG